MLSCKLVVAYLNSYGVCYFMLLLLLVASKIFWSSSYMKVSHCVPNKPELNQVAVACFDILLVFQVYSLYELIIYLHLV